MLTAAQLDPMAVLNANKKIEVCIIIAGYAPFLKYNIFFVEYVE